MRFVVDRAALEQDFVRVLRFSYDHINPPMRHTHPHIYVAVTEGQMGEP
jgi:hypothetical protein